MSRLPVHYTFGNHMHWVDMQWLWGYHVLPGSIDDMLRFCQETGAQGCVNFDGIGFEKLAAEAPEALNRLREAVEAGVIEPVGGSYGQPYGQFHGGESNVRQRIFGARAVHRLLGVRPQTFWEEEFDFFPQLPQILAGCGFRYASLFFQWTWHTPEVPKEESPVIWWTGVDGSQLLAATRNALNLHQWPEDFDGLLEQLAAAPRYPNEQMQTSPPLILQWLELMPSKDWMCRSEVLLPRMKELLNDPRFEVRFGTLGDYLSKTEAASESRSTSAIGRAGSNIPERTYAANEVWHGMSLGKNWDGHPRKSAYIERMLVAGEALHAMLGLFGRPYANWDVYPTWEFEEAWRHLLAFQHHDNHECEGLCGHVADGLYVNAFELGRQVDRGLRHLAKRLDAPDHALVNFNPLGKDSAIGSRVSNHELASIVDTPAFGYAVVDASEFDKPVRKWEIQGVLARFADDDFEVEVNVRDGSLRMLRGPGASIRFSQDDKAFPKVQWMSAGKEVAIGPVESVQLHDDGSSLELVCGPDRRIVLRYTLCLEMAAIDLNVGVNAEGLVPDPGLAPSIQLTFPHEAVGDRIVADSPYCIQTVRPSGPWRRKYPEGDWMTSPQWFETVDRSATGLTFVDLVSDRGEGLMVVHGGSQQWLFPNGEARMILHLRDPWDEDRTVNSGQKTLRLIPHGPLKMSQRRTMADASSTYFPGLSSGAYRTLVPTASQLEGPPLPQRFRPVSCRSANVILSAFYRETEDFAGRGLPHYAGRGMGYPYVLRLVEYDGQDGDVELIVAGPIAKAAKCNLMGEVESWLEPRELSETELAEVPLAASTAELEPFGIVPQRLVFRMRPFEIATLYLDLVPGRKQPRDLDAKREVWATVHRVEEPG